MPGTVLGQPQAASEFRLRKIQTAGQGVPNPDRDGQDRKDVVRITLILSILDIPVSDSRFGGRAGVSWNARRVENSPWRGEPAPLEDSTLAHRSL